MGGFGSTRWKNHKKACTVESCPFLDTMIFGRDGQLEEDGSTGTITWEGLGSANYAFDRRGPDEMTVRLNYVAGPEDSARFVSEVLSLTPTYPHSRWPALVVLLSWLQWPSPQGLSAARAPSIPLPQVSSTELPQFPGEPHVCRIRSPVHAFAPVSR